MAYLFAYSMREKTTAHRRYEDDIPQAVKLERLQRMSATFRRHASLLNRAQIEQTQLILVEGDSRKSSEQLVGRNDGNLKVVIPKTAVPSRGSPGLREVKPGDYVVVRVSDATSQALRGEPLYHTTLAEDFRKKEDPYASIGVDYMKYNSMM